MQKLSIVFLLSIFLFGCSKEIPPNSQLTTTRSTVMQTSPTSGIVNLVPLYDQNNKPTGEYYCFYTQNGASITIHVSGISYKTYDDNGNTLYVQLGDPCWGNISVGYSSDDEWVVSPPNVPDNHFLLAQGVQGASMGGGGVDMSGYESALNNLYNSWYTLYTAASSVGLSVAPFNNTLKITDYISGSSSAGSINYFSGKLIRTSSTDFAIAPEDWTPPIIPAQIGLITSNGYVLHCYGNLYTGVITSIKTDAGLNVNYQLTAGAFSVADGYYYETGTITLPSGVVVSGTFTAINYY